MSKLRRILLFPYQLLVIVFFFLSLVFWGVVASLAGLGDPGGARAHRCLGYWARSSLLVCGLRIEIGGRDRLASRAAYVFMPNHASFLDILLVLAFVPGNFRIITKQEIFWLPIMGWALKRSGQIPMDRQNPRKGLLSLRWAEGLLRKGVSVVVFPEGTRTPSGALGEFKPTLFILPIRTGTAVVPIRIEGTYEALKRGSVLLDPVPLKLTFLDPVPAAGLTDADRWRYAERVRKALLSS